MAFRAIPLLSGQVLWGVSMIKTVASSVIAWLLLGGVAVAQSTSDLFPDPDSAAKNSVKLTTVLMAIPAGMPWLTLRNGLFCNNAVAVRNATGGREPQDLPPYVAAFKTELERVGYKVMSDDKLFDSDSVSADYQVAAVITDARVVACLNSGALLEAGNLGDARGDGSMKIEWQVYSPLRKQVVARLSTNGSIELENTIAGGVAQLITGSFASNARELAANAEFRTAVNAPKAALAAQGVLLPGQQGKINLIGNLKAPTRPIAEAVGSVVTLFVGSASGSGVLVSDDGYLLTNAHVVSDAKDVRVRWPDGIETVGQVTRVAKDRDIALVKTNARDRIPLALKRGAVSPGQRVYAIGTPLDKTFQGTVSSGIISANRIIDGLRYIQSDTNILPGSSGGALLDETGSVIGIVVSGYQKDGQAVGLNMFIPIGDAMDFLSLERQ